MRFRVQPGIRPGHRQAAARLYWQAFGGKLGSVLGPEARAMAFLDRVMRLDHAFGAVDGDGRLVGIVGFRTPQGAFAGGTAQDMRAVYGTLGGTCRGALIGLLQREIDNDRFLLDGICVDRVARGQGVGTALLAAVCDEAARRGFAAVRLDVIDTNWRARALYERQGFVATRTARLGPLRHVFGFAAATTMVRPVA